MAAVREGALNGRRTLGDRRSDLGEEDAKAGLKDVGAEAFGVTAKHGWVPFNALEARNGFGQVFGLLAIEEDAGNAIDDGLDSAPSAVGDGRAAGRRDLKRRHAKVLFTGKDERTAAGGVVLHRRIREKPKKGDGGTGIGHEALRGRARRL